MSQDGASICGAKLDRLLTANLRRLGTSFADEFIGFSAPENCCKNRGPFGVSKKSHCQCVSAEIRVARKKPHPAQPLPLVNNRPSTERGDWVDLSFSYESLAGVTIPVNEPAPLA